MSTGATYFRGLKGSFHGNSFLNKSIIDASLDS
jgi:hypothetical protein